MKQITANFEIIDNTGMSYSSNVVVSNPSTYNFMQEIKERIMKVYNVTIEQIISIGGIQLQDKSETHLY